MPSPCPNIFQTQPAEHISTGKPMNMEKRSALTRQSQDANPRRRAANWRPSSSMGNKKENRMRVKDRRQTTNEKRLAQEVIIKRVQQAYA